jgi:hypothetical protein
MKISTFLTVTAALAISLTTVSRAATQIIEDGTTTPTITGPSVGGFFGYDDASFDGTEGFTGGSNSGETFLTPGTSPTFSLDSITLQESAGSGPSDASLEAITYTLGIFSVSNGTLTSLGTEDYTFGSSVPGTGGYFTLDTTALGLTLSGNTEYAFTFENAVGSPYGYLGLVSSAYGDTTTGEDSYTNGVAIWFDAPLPAGGTEAVVESTDGNGNTYDRAFEVGLAVPEPSTYAMLLAGLIFLIALGRRRLEA